MDRRDDAMGLSFADSAMTVAGDIHRALMLQKMEDLYFGIPEQFCKVERKEEMGINGKNLKAEMVRSDLSLSDLGEKLGIGSYAVESYCDDMTTMPASVLVQAARLFGCSTDWLLGRTEERTSATRVTPW